MNPDSVQRAVQAGLFVGTDVVLSAVLIGVCRLAATGRLKRNPWVGIRTRATTCSDGAWTAGHRAALRLTPLFLGVAGIDIAALLLALWGTETVGAIVLIGIAGLAVYVAVALYAAVVAGRAARAVDD